MAFAFLLLVFFWFAFSVKPSHFNKPFSTVVTSEEGYLLGARIAADEQWRFPSADSIPVKFKKSLLVFEDKLFYHHPGINPVAIARAAYLNLKNGRIVSGGSTLSMQVIRMLFSNGKRTVWKKAGEMILAIRLELTYTKDEILSLYASHAPFGGNVVGLEAASWKYFNRSPFDLSWAESATLAVLPNAPALIHPGKNRRELKKKRDKLLKDLWQHQVIDSLDYQLALLEPIPDKPYDLPLYAKHLTDRIEKQYKGKKVKSTLKFNLQLQMERVLNQYHEQLKHKHIHNIAAVIVNVNEGNVIAYAGNVYGAGAEHQHEVDVVQSARSTGSILKPLLFSALLDDGKISSESLIADVPVQIAGYSPENFTREYDGAVKAKNALTRSLNVPAVLMLREYGLQKFHRLLKNMGLTSINNPAGHYGLSLILGGAEASLWDLAEVYSSCAQKLNHFQQLQRMPTALKYAANATTFKKQDYLPNAGALWLMFEALLEVNRPGNESGWKHFSSSRKVAWKTGTSFGFKDAWAIGTTPEFLVAVWVGNADGEGRPGITGIEAAAPVMFDLFDLLPPSTWFEQPLDEMKKVTICPESGFAPSPSCPKKDTIWSTAKSSALPTCRYHEWVHLEETHAFRVNKNCYAGQIQTSSWFVLPPHLEYYYQKSHAGYKKLPPWHPNCKNKVETTMRIVFPADVKKVYIPRNLDGSRSEILFEVAHRDPAKMIYWHLDETFLGVTENLHEYGFLPTEGQHTLTLIDQEGNTLSASFEVIDKDDG